MRRLLARSGCLLVVSMPLTAGSTGACAQTDLAGQIAAMVAEPAVVRAHWGVMVTALDGSPIYQLNAGQLFQPASNAKLFTTAAAVHLLGKNRRFTTTVEGPEATGGGTTLQGNLTLRGAGDANLAGYDVPYIEPSDRARDVVTAIDPLHDVAEIGPYFSDGNHACDGRCDW